MASRLLDAGHSLVVFDTNPAATAPLAARGCVVAASPEDVASKAEVVFISLPTPPIVQAVTTGEGGVLRGSKVQVLVDLSTTGPSVAGVAAKAARRATWRGWIRPSAAASAAPPRARWP